MKGTPRAGRSILSLAATLVVLLSSACREAAPAPPATTTPDAHTPTVPSVSTPTELPTVTEVIPSATWTPAPLHSRTATATAAAASTGTASATTAATASATATASARATATATPAPDATLKVGWLGSVESLWPFADMPTDADTILALIYDRLIDRLPDNTYAPALATSWSSSDEGQTWTLQLESGATTHDGQLYTADDVVFALEQFRGNPRFEYYCGQVPQIESLEANGTSSVTIKMSRPVRNIEATLHWIPMLPRHRWESLAMMAAGEIVLDVLVGTGPFVLQEFVPGEYVTLVANRVYWKEPPNIGRLEFHTYPNANILASALQAGSVDLITQVPLPLLRELRLDPNVQVVSGPANSLRKMILNVSTEARSTGHPALLDPRVRLAIAHAVDKQQVVDGALGGRGMPGLGVIPPMLHTWFNATLQDPTFDLEEANAVLDTSGYADTDGDGIREMPDGTVPLNLRLFISADSATGSREAEMIGGWLRQIGIGVLPQTLLKDSLKSVCCPAYDYDLILTGQHSGPDPGYVLSAMTTAHIPTGRNETGYSRPEYDALCTQQADASDDAQRQETVMSMQQIIHEDRMLVVLYYELKVQAFRKDRFQNWQFILNGLLALEDRQSLVVVEPIQ